MKRILCALCAVLLGFSLAFALPVEAKAYNRSWFDTVYNFTEAVVFRADGEEHVKVRSWCDYENSDMIQITLEDGTSYLTHASNVILIARGK